MEVNQNLPIMDFSDNETGCCPRFHPENWDSKVFNFDSLKFIKASTKSFMHVPLDMSKVMTRTMEAIDSAKASVSDQYLILSKDVSNWRCDHYFLVASDVPGFPVQTLNGNYFAKVYDGEFKEIPHWMKDFDHSIQQKGFVADDFMSFYTTCPKCAAHYGHNYVVLFAKLSANDVINS